jgi:hypothetical protein
MHRLWPIVVLVALGRTAHADRDHQAEQLLHGKCGDCHVVARGKAAEKLPHAFVDLTLSTRQHDDAWLKAWIKNPQAIKPDSRCYTRGLDASQIEAILGFLHARTQLPRTHAVAPQQLKPPLPPDPPKPPRGLARGQ